MSDDVNDRFFDPEDYRASAAMRGRKRPSELAAPAGSADGLQICLHCDYWEAPPRNIVDPLGYCSLFDKLTLPGHGLQCTGWTKRNPSNS